MSGTRTWRAQPTAGHDKHGQSVVYDETNGSDLALVYDGKAHADLIAAAPDLLAALTVCINALHNKAGQTTSDKAQRAVELAIAAIAKAEGRV